MKKKIRGYYFAMKILLFIILGHISIKKKFVISISWSIIFWWRPKSCFFAIPVHFDHLVEKTFCCFSVAVDSLRTHLCLRWNDTNNFSYLQDNSLNSINGYQNYMTYHCNISSLLNICWNWWMAFWILIQVNLCQKPSFLHHLTHNMTRDCLLNSKKNTGWQYVVYKYCFECQNKNRKTIFVHNMF